MELNAKDPKLDQDGNEAPRNKTKSIQHTKLKYCLKLSCSVYSHAAWGYVNSSPLQNVPQSLRCLHILQLQHLRAYLCVSPGNPAIRPPDRPGQVMATGRPMTQTKWRWPFEPDWCFAPPTGYARQSHKFLLASKFTSWLKLKSLALASRFLSPSVIQSLLAIFPKPFPVTGTCWPLWGLPCYLF